MLSKSAREFMLYLRKTERDAKARMRALRRAYDSSVAQMRQEDIHLIRNNGRSSVDWKHYE